MHEFDIAITISIALLAGLSVQTVAHHLRIPGIVLLLITGAILGQEGLKLINPQVYHSSLHMLVGFAVAVILFEGGLNLEIKRLRRESKPIRQLITIGMVITVSGATLTARYLLGWDWQLSLLFGTLVSVTGPTVVNPILRRIKINRNVQTVLEAEGVFSDSIGALMAIIALEIVVHPSESSFLFGIGHLIIRLGFGGIVGVIGGFLLAYLLRPKKLIPENFKNIFALTFVLALFHLSNYFQGESGIAAVTVAGIVVGNIQSRSLTELVEFKEQLTTMFIAMLFVLLAADVQFVDLRSLGMSGILVVIVLMLVIRPLNVFVSTAGTNMSLAEKSFLSWLAPRGIVAAAVASFFAVTLENAEYEGGAVLRALVFLVIAITVTVQGITGGWVAKLLKLTRKANAGFTILGANMVALELARALKDNNQEVQFIDSNVDAVKYAQDSDFKVLFGNALEDSILIRGRVDTMKGCIALTPNEEINLLFLQKVKDDFKIEKLYMSLHVQEGHISVEMIEEIGGSILFGAKRDIDLWNVRLRRKTAVVEKWQCASKNDVFLVDRQNKDAPVNKVLLPLVVKKGNNAEPVTSETKVKSGDEVVFIIFEDKRKEANQWFASEGWIFVRQDKEHPDESLS